MAWWIPAAIAAGSKLIGAVSGSGGRKKQKKAYKELSGLGEELRGFDPMAYAKEASQAQWNMLQTPLAESIGDLRASQSERGAFRTGPAFAQEDRMYRDIQQNFWDQVAGRSMEAGGMKLGALGQAGDVYASQYDIGAREEDKAWKRWTGLGSDIAASYLFGA